MNKVYEKLLSILANEIAVTGKMRIPQKRMDTILKENEIKTPEELKKFTAWILKPTNQEKFKKELREKRIEAMK